MARSAFEGGEHRRARVIGGNGSQTGAAALAKTGFPVVGLASTIDNDLIGTEISIGVGSALNIALAASSHHRAFLVEAMGRSAVTRRWLRGLQVRLKRCPVASRNQRDRMHLGPRQVDGNFTIQARGSPFSNEHL